MKESELTEIEIFPAKIVIGESYAYCSEWGEIIDTEDKSCGKQCSEYSPRNGKSGRCRHSKNCYEPSDEPIILRQPKPTEP